MIRVKSYALFFAALADESRLRLLHLMREGEVCVCYLQGTLKTNQPKISRHLAYLRRAGLVEARRQGKWIHYRLKRQPSKLQRILSDALAAIAEEPQIARDNRRAKEIHCSPSRFGLSAPDAS
jgi:ArsR family transcriptional regulator